MAPQPMPSYPAAASPASHDPWLAAIEETQRQTAEAHTTYGVIGVKVWIYKGEVFNLYGSEGENKRNQQAAS